MKATASGFKGVFRSYGTAKPWRAMITVDGDVKFLGLFDDPKEASDAYQAAALRYRQDERIQIPADDLLPVPVAPKEIMRRADGTFLPGGAPGRPGAKNRLTKYILEGLEMEIERLGPAANPLIVLARACADEELEMEIRVSAAGKLASILIPKGLEFTKLTPQEGDPEVVERGRKSAEVMMSFLLGEASVKKEISDGRE